MYEGKNNKSNNLKRLFFDIRLLRSCTKVRAKVKPIRSTIYSHTKSNFMTKLTFTVYQKGVLRSGKDHEGAAELTANVDDTKQLSHILGGIFTEFFAFASTIKAVNSRLWALSLPVYLRFEYKGEIIDTASYHKAIASTFKYGNTPERRKAWAKKLWAAINYDIMQRIPAVYLPASGELQTTKLLEQNNSRLVEINGKLSVIREQLAAHVGIEGHDEKVAKNMVKQISRLEGQAKKLSYIMGA